MAAGPLTLTSFDAPGAPTRPAAPGALQADFTRRLKEDFGWLPIPMLRAADDWASWGDGGHTLPGPGVAFGTPADRKAGRDLPVFWNELDLRAHRVMARQLCDSNAFAIGFQNRLTDYHIRKGFGWQACLKGSKKTPYATAGANSDPLITKAQNILDAWRDANQWPLRSREAFKRWRRDGEVFGRLFRRGWDRLASFRFVEPEQVGSPTGDTSTSRSFGIRTDPEDIETRWEYHLWSLDDSGQGEWVDADGIIHARANVDSTIKRGIPDFYPVYQQLDRVRQLLDTILLTAIRQAGVAWREKFKTATATQISGIIPAGPGANSNPPNALGLPWWFNGPGRPGGNRMPPGTVQRVEGDREFADGPVAGGIGNFLEAEQAAIRACCVRWGIPEYTGSADASNNNFASSLVAGSPFAVAVEGSQFEWGTVWEKPIALKVLDLAVEAGLLTADERRRLDVEMTEPSVVTPEPEKEAQTLTSLLTAKVVCLDTVRQKLGYDPQHESEGVKQDAAAAPQPPAVQQQPGVGPAAPSASPPGILYAGESRRVHEAAPGPAPRPGLVWKDQTKRWVNPKTGEEHPHEPDKQSGFDPRKPPADQKNVHADNQSGTYLHQKADGTLETPLPPEGDRKAIVKALAPALAKAWEDIPMLLDVEGGLLPLKTVINTVMRNAPEGTTVNDVQAALFQLSKDRKIQLSALNEVQKLDTPEKKAGNVIWSNDRALGFLQGRSTDELDLSGYAGAGAAPARAAPEPKAEPKAQPKEKPQPTPAAQPAAGAAPDPAVIDRVKKVLRADGVRATDALAMSPAEQDEYAADYKIPPDSFRAAIKHLAATKESLVWMTATDYERLVEAGGSAPVAAPASDKPDDGSKLAAIFGENLIRVLFAEHGFTGTDRRGVKWVDGVPQKAATAGTTDQPAAAAAPEQGAGEKKPGTAIPTETETELAAAFPEAAKNPGVWGKVKHLVATVNHRVGMFLLNHEKTIGIVAGLLDAAMTTPEDMAKNPALMGKFASTGDASSDAGTAASKDMLGIGIPPTVIAKALATVVFKAWGLAKKALGITSRTEGDNVGLAAEFLAGLMAAAAEETGLRTPDAAAIAEFLRGQVAAR